MLSFICLQIITKATRNYFPRKKQGFLWSLLSKLKNFMGHWSTGHAYCMEDTYACLLMALLTHQRAQCFLENHRCCPGREQV